MFVLILVKQKQCSILCALRLYPLTLNAPDSLPPAGVVLLDKDQGFWLVHSTPHFPPVQKAGQFSYPSSGVVYGQNFICVTYPLERFQTIGKAGDRMRAKVKLGGCCAASFKCDLLATKTLVSPNVSVQHVVALPSCVHKFESSLKKPLKLSQCFFSFYTC